MIAGLKHKNKHQHSKTFNTMKERERNVLFNDALNIFYLRLYGVGHMVKDHSDSERGNLLPSHGLLFPISRRVLLYAYSHRQDNTYHILCYTSRGALVGTRNSSLGPPHEGLIRRPIAPWANALPLSYVPPPIMKEGRKEMFYLTTHSTHFIYGYMASDS